MEKIMTIPNSIKKDWQMIFVNGRLYEYLESIKPKEQCYTSFLIDILVRAGYLERVKPVPEFKD